jgi:nucleoside-diphosphate-sugar epimerase
LKRRLRQVSKKNKLQELSPVLCDSPASRLLSAEEALFESALEPTNQWYAVAKIAGLKMCEAHRRQWGCDLISVMPTNLYGRAT